MNLAFSQLQNLPRLLFQCMSPQVYLDTMLSSRGYSTQRFKTLQTSYYNKPTDHQIASYSVYLIQLLRVGDIETFKNIMACGISPNPCNAYGESLVHSVCRRGDHEMLQVFVQNGCALNVCDDYGRTPLHDACWAVPPAFEVVKMILKEDVRLFHMIDSRDRLPLGYVREEDWPTWIDFLDAHKDVYWPTRNTDREEEPPRLTREGCNTRPLPDPVNALSLELTEMVATGRMKPEEAIFLHTDATTSSGETKEKSEDNTTVCLSDADDSFSSDYDSDYDSDEYGSEYDGDDDFFEDDMEGLLADMAALRGQ